MLSQATGYAATALGYLAASGGKPLLVKDMAEACAIPAAYLAKIVHTLGRRNIVTTQRGVGGGVALAVQAPKLTLYDLCNALDDPIVQPRCLLGVAQCSDDRACPAHEFWKAHRLKIVDFLKTTTVADIAAFETSRRWKHRGSIGVTLGLPPTPPAAAPTAGPTANAPDKQ